MESISNRSLTRADRKDVAAETNKSAITDYVAKENHVIEWSSAKILDKGIKKQDNSRNQSVHCKKANCMNRDRGAYNLPTTYDRILVTNSSSVSRDHMPVEDRHWRTKRRN